MAAFVVVLVDPGPDLLLEAAVMVAPGRIMLLVVVDRRESLNPAFTLASAST